MELAPGWWRELRRLAWVLLLGLAVGWLLWPVTRQAPLSPSAVTVATLVLGGLLLNGYFYAELRWWNALLLLVAPFAALLADRRRKGKGWLVPLAVALVPLAYTIGTEFRPAPRKPLDSVLHVNSW